MIIKTHYYLPIGHISFINGGCNNMGVVYLDGEGPSNDSLHKQPVVSKASKADIKRDASALVGLTLKNLMVEKEEAPA
jgi:hypothetical protein